MSDIKDWSTTASSNNAAAPNGAPEGWAPSAVNAVVRENMRAVRAFYANIEWREFGDATGTNDCHTVAYSSATTFATSAGDGDTTAVYHAGRRIRAVGSTTGTIYGTIASSTGNPTTVTVVWDSGSLSSEALTISLGPGVTGNPIFPTTTQGDLIVRGSSADERLAIGAAGTHLVGGTEPSWVSGASQRLSDSWVYSTGVTTLDFETGFDDGFDHLFIISNVAPDVADVLNFRVKEGGSYVATTNSYRYGGIANTTTTAGGGVGQSTLGVTTSSNVAATEHISGTLLLHNPASSSFRTECEFFGSSASSATATGKKSVVMGTEREAAGACQGVRFLWNGSNDFAAGAITHYRRKTT